ncbi:MAG: SWIM zinc finger family protein [Alphaproteobacteria bacterium]
MSRYSYYPPYVSVAERKERAQKVIKKSQKNGMKLSPVFVEGRNIANTFWGKAWCKHIETFEDCDYRLPRGRSYLRSRAVIDLAITEGHVIATVLGSSKYTVKISIGAVATQKWEKIVAECSGQIDSVMALLQGTLSKPIMEKMTNIDSGLFPALKEVSISCSCPDYAKMCKHVAAVLYGIGSRLDHSPQDLFTLRNVSPMDLMQAPLIEVLVAQSESSGLEGDLSDLFCIDLVEQPIISKKFKAKVVTKEKSKESKTKER